MGVGYANRGMEPQHNSLQNNKFYIISVNVQSRSDAAGRDKTPKLASHSREYNMSQ
jgi:hypothetical protein